MRVEKHPTCIPGCYELHPMLIRDARGTFVKTFHEATFERLGLQTHFTEQFHTTSLRGVIRGLHFQCPPHDHAKLVYCIAGRVLDVGVDLRRGSPTYGQHLKIELNAEFGNMIYLPPGIAHGFLTIADTATLVYNVTSMHVPEADTGIRWDSAGVST
jgi:dTDP-4-dehydrorhamnose 3,5-epimerase